MGRNSSGSDLLARRSGILVALIAAAGFAIQLPSLLGNNDQDLFIYRAGARLGLGGHSPYDTAALRELVRGQYPGDERLVENCGFFLAPQAVVVFAPFAALPWPAAKAAWALALFALGGLAVWRLPAFTTCSGVARLLPLVAAGLLLNPITVTGAIVGQTPLLVFACVVLGESAYRAGWRRLAGLLWAVPFVKPHLALPLLPLAWYLGGWRRAAELALWVAGLNLLGCLVSAGSPLLVRDYLHHLAAGHKAVEFNLAERNPQITSWNRLLIAAGGPVVEQSAATTLAGYAVWAGLVAARVRLAGRRPTPAWALAAAAVGAVLCCQVLGYELVLLGLVAPHVLDLAAAGRKWAAAGFVAVLVFVSVPFEVVRTVADGGVLLSHRSIGVALLAVGVLAEMGPPVSRVAAP